MSSSIAPYLETMWSETNVDTVLEAQRRLVSLVTREDLPELVDALKSDRNDFWTRELISEPVAYLGAVDSLPEPFEALEKNSSDGHDGDSLVHFLIEIAMMNPEACRARLEELKDPPDSVNTKFVDWLLEFCN